MQLKAILKLSLLGIATIIAMTGAAIAQETKSDVGNTGQVGHPERPSVKIVAVESDAKVDTAISQNGGSVTFGSLTLTVQVDNTVCATGSVQCSGPGLSHTLPANTNRNPVRLGIQVLNGTTPETTLTDANINVVTSFVPAGGSLLAKLSCPNCFQNAGNGVYAIYVNPFSTFNWKSGSYFIQIQVTTGVITHRALAQIEIPF